MKVFMFPGQGSQKTGMGRDLFDQVPEFLAAERQLDKILGYSVRALCLEVPATRLNQTQFTQPALFVVNALHYYAGVRRSGRPDFAIGHSLGEYDALLAAGAFDLETGVRLVQKRGALMAAARNGGMAAVVGLTSDRIADVLRQNRFDGMDVANYNSPKQTVISGPSAEIQRAKDFMQKAGATLYFPLPVSAAFHSRYMESAARDFEMFLAPIRLNRLQIPVIANVTAQPYPADERGIKSLLVRQISQPVKWTASITYLRSAGATQFDEMGPGNALSKLMNDMPAVQSTQAHTSAAF